MTELPSIHAPRRVAPIEKSRWFSKWRWAPSSKDVRYLAVVTICAIVNNILLIALVKAGVHYFVGIWLAYIPMTVFGYGLHVSVTFRTPPTLGGFVRYGLAMLANYPLWIASLFVLSSLLRMPITVAAPIGTAITFFGNYVTTHLAILRSLQTAFWASSEVEKGSVDPAAAHARNFHNLGA
jgi:putative flippase GtrA